MLYIFTVSLFHTLFKRGTYIYKTGVQPSYIIIINPILMRVYPRKWGWLDLPHFVSNLSNSHSPSRSITSPAHTPYISSPHPHPKPLIRLRIILQAVLARPKVRGCTFLFVVGKCGPPQPLGWLVPMFSCCHHEGFIGAHSFYGEHALAYPQHRFSDTSGPETKAFTIL